MSPDSRAFSLALYFVLARISLTILRNPFFSSPRDWPSTSAESLTFSLSNRSRSLPSSSSMNFLINCLSSLATESSITLDMSVFLSSSKSSSSSLFPTVLFLKNVTISLMFATLPTNRLEKRRGFSTSYPPLYSTRNLINGNGMSISTSVSRSSLLASFHFSVACSIKDSTSSISKFVTSSLLPEVAGIPDSLRTTSFIAKGRTDFSRMGSSELNQSLLSSGCRNSTFPAASVLFSRSSRMLWSPYRAKFVEPFWNNSGLILISSLLVTRPKWFNNPPTESRSSGDNRSSPVASSWLPEIAYTGIPTLMLGSYSHG
ncbi:hypothetical protein OGAPHI_005004 [Ogataea philodendri]|uniref:Uncharacterized protein n=1 Tax=Ogataea philodendri TaxID=1378263 RepID=A0A9P8T284_9ASCO|nr:uncharacterized protein OGAPHI_005004 [Ogataea philodendri]KAH3663603.1 hypothetical protein OGAPHI_005004 [Ogataea philodendri]